MKYSHSIIHSILNRYNLFRWMNYVQKHPGIDKIDIDKVVLFDTSIGTSNLGDKIIEYYSRKALLNVLRNNKVIHVPTHNLPSEDQLVDIRTSKTKIVCGTNLITPHIENFSNWKMPYNLTGYRDIVTMGVGWGFYCDNTSRLSKFVYNTILSKDKFHSVRDSYTEKKFHDMGILNVINTGCPTLWELTPEHCSLIPKKKAGSVITTVTDYDRNVKADQNMLNILQKNYAQVFVWPQGSEDLNYLESFTDMSQMQIIERDIKHYTRVLDKGNIDYVGTRLHAGIHALNRGIRTIILGIDNRAIEMGRDFNLPILERSSQLDELSMYINSEWETVVNVPFDAVNRWKSQF